MVTLTPTRQGFAGKQREAHTEEEDRPGTIETPSWILVKAGEDDREEALDEMDSFGVLGGKGVRSPVKRLRRALPDEVCHHHTASEMSSKSG